MILIESYQRELALIYKEDDFYEETLAYTEYTKIMNRTAVYNNKGQISQSTIVTQDSYKTNVKKYKYQYKNDQLISYQYIQHGYAPDAFDLELYLKNKKAYTSLDSTKISNTFKYDTKNRCIDVVQKQDNKIDFKYQINYLKDQTHIHMSKQDKPFSLLEIHYDYAKNPVLFNHYEYTDNKKYLNQVTILDIEYRD